jgi:riboflavin synthase
MADVGYEADGSGWAEVWLIPETLRLTTFGQRSVGDRLNIEIERSTQAIVDTVTRVLDEKWGPLMRLLPLLQQWADEKGFSINPPKA